MTEIHDLPFFDLLRLVKRAGFTEVGAPVGKQLTHHIDPAYKFERFLGEGGESVVWAAYNPVRGVSVAIKAALPYIAGQGQRTVEHYRGIRGQKLTKVEYQNTFKDRFLRGVDLQKELAPIIFKMGVGLIPRVISFPRLNDVQGKPLFIEMEKINGLPLLEHVRELPIIERLNIFVKVLLLVNEIHSFGIIHRDLKSANWMFEGEKPVLLDFGIAKQVQGEDDNITVERTRLGTKFYSSPEQLSDAGICDYATDIYTLGEVLLDLLTGKYPNEKRPEITEFTAGLQKIYRKATEVKKLRRFQVVADLIRAIQDYLKASVNSNFDHAATSVLKQIDGGDVILLWYKAIKKITER